MRTPKLHDALLVHRCGWDGQPAVALVCRVWSDRVVNAGGFNPTGSAITFSSLSLLQEGDPVPSGSGPYATFASPAANLTAFQAAA